MSEVKFYYIPFILGIVVGIVLVYMYKEEKVIIYALDHLEDEDEDEEFEET